MRILILCDHFGTGGGAGNIALAMAQGLIKDKKNEVQVLTAHSAPKLSFPQNQIFQHDLDYNPKLRNHLGLHHSIAVKIFKDHIGKFRPDVIFIHNLHTNWSYYCLKAASRQGIKTILTFHDVAAFTPYMKLCQVTSGSYHYSWWRHLRQAKFTYNPFRNRSIKNYLNFASQTVAVSHELKSALEQNGVKVDTVIHNGLSTTPKPTTPTTKPGSELKIFFGGRLSTSKGALQSVDYLKILKDKYDLTPTLVVAGEEGIVTEKMKKMATSLGVASQLQFLGWLDKKKYNEALVKSTLIIVPSICFDSFPTMILEAMSLGKPVVATNLGGAKEMVVEGKTGYIADPLDSEEFSAKIAELCQDPEIAAVMGSRGYDKFIKEFTVETMIEAYLNL